MSDQEDEDKVKQDKLLLQPYKYILQCAGKQVRTKLIQAFNHWLQIPDDKIVIISEIVEMLHNASLLIDDIEDNSILRRGIPVAHHIFGIATTINAANYVYFLSLEKMTKHFPSELMPQAVNIFTQQMLQLHQGQGMDIYWRDSFTCPSESQYLDMVKRKTGGLFNLGVQLMQLFSQDKRDFSKLIELLGTYFQIRDDFANLKLTEYTENKSFCEDLTEGKFSFPIVHAINNHPDDPTILNIIRKRTTDVEMKKFAVDLLERLGSFEYSLSTLKDLDTKSRHECARLGGNDLLLQIMDYLKMNHEIKK